MQELFAPVYDLVRLFQRSALFRNFDFSLKNPFVLGALAGLTVSIIIALFWASGRKKRTLRRNLKTLLASGRFRDAGEIYFGMEKWTEALDCFLKGKVYSRAARVHEMTENFAEAGRLYEEAGAIESAVEAYRKGGIFERATFLLCQVDRGIEAARLLEKEGRKLEAAKVFIAQRDFLEAGRIFLDLKNFKEAGKAFAQEFTQQASRMRLSTSTQLMPEQREIARKAAAAFLQANETIEAAKCFEQCEDFVRAASLYQEAKDWRSAGEALRRAGRLEDAARVFADHGMSEQAYRMRAEDYRKKGNVLEAAQCYRQAKDFIDAADLWLQLDHKKNAADCYAEAGDFLEAATLYAAIDDHVPAAACFEKAGAFEEAARHHLALGALDRQRDLLLKAGKKLMAAENFIAAKAYDKAIPLLQDIEAGHIDYPAAARLLGRVFFEKGMEAVALKKLQEATQNDRVSASNIEDFYLIGLIHQKNSDLAKAGKVFEDILATQYNFRDVPDRLGQIQLELSQKTQPGKPEVAVLTGAPHGTIAFQEPISPDRFELMEELGRGGMGIVYKARDRVLNRLLALKYLPANFAKNSQAIRSFQREAQSTAILNHPGIVTIFDVGFDSRGNYIAMEYLEGRTLKNMIRENGALPVSDVVRVGVEIAAALHYAHEKHIIHRDVKCSNMLWCRDGKIKLMDFGLAKFIQDAKNSATQISGTPYYMSPEQTLGQDLDLRTDVYSLGVSLFEMAAGQVPFKDGDIGYHQVHSAAPSLQALNPRVPASLAQVIARCMEKDKNSRFATAAALATALQKTSE